jgi:hypothetical protein
VDIDARVAKLHTNEEMMRIAIECGLHFAFETSDVETREWNDGSRLLQKQEVLMLFCL